MKGKSLLLGFLVGGVAAGITTLLTAPASGKDTRKYIVENKDSLKEQLSILKENVSEVSQSISSLTKEGKEGIGAFIQDIKTLTEAWKTDIAPHQEQLKKELQALQESLNDLELKLESSKKA